VTSATYRQASTRRTNLAEIDPDNRLLASFPRQRLPAESVRDLALHAAGLLVEELGGPSVKPYQPEGLWQEVAMPASNTRYYERGGTRDLWRRSLYTYWKRAAPPPTLLAFDAPTRESCVIRRATTNTPLQALALWNDPQFVEAARVLAQRTLLEAGAPSAGARDAHTTPPNAASAHAAPSVAATSAATSQTAAPTGDDDRIVRLVRRVTGARPDVGELNALRTTLADFRARYRAAPDDARALLAVGEAPRDTALDPAEHAAWTLLASAVLSLDAAITRD
jgi:hypothetical protein